MALRPKILIVDDEQEILTAVVDMLEQHGYHALTALNGPKALLCAEEETPNLILLDIMMPDMDGPELLVKFRQEATLKDIPVIFLTGKTDPAQVIRFGELGAQGVIQKPFQPLELADKLMAILEAGET